METFSWPVGSGTAVSRMRRRAVKSRSDGLAVQEAALKPFAEVSGGMR